MGPRTVGILGGMGPEATVLLMQKVIAAVPARDDSDHVPLIVDQNSQVPSRIRRLIEGTGEDPAPVLAAMARRLEGAGAEALAMPCNTAHHYADAIRGAAHVPLLDMVALSVAKAKALAGEGASIGILASPAVKAHGPTEAARAALKAASEELLARGARVQMVACTEFSLIADAVAEGVTAFDTLDALVDEIVAFSRG